MKTIISTTDMMIITILNRADVG